MAYVVGEIGPDKDRLSRRKLAVSTDRLQFYTWVAPELADELGMEFPTSIPAATANDGRKQTPAGMAHVRVQSEDGLIREAPIHVVLMEVKDVGTPVLGQAALQTLGLKVSATDGDIRFSGAYPPPV
jgi:hypothetical protein